MVTIHEDETENEYHIYPMQWNDQKNTHAISKHVPTVKDLIKSLKFFINYYNCKKKKKTFFQNELNSNFIQIRILNQNVL
jgi:hypothetical protein